MENDMMAIVMAAGKGTRMKSKNSKLVQKIYGKEICFIMQNPMTAFNPSLRVGKQLKK